MDQPTSSVPKNVTLWIKDGKNSVRVVQATQKKVLMTASGGATAPQIQTRQPQPSIRFVKTSGLDALAKEAAIIESATGLTNLKLRQAISKCSPHMVALPVTNSSVVTKMSPFKSEPSILPKPPHVSSSPMILSAPQRIVNLAAASPRTPQSILSPVMAADSSLAWSTKRGHEFADMDFMDGGKRSKKGGEKGGKGLRHFSMKVCEKVQKKGVTSYNEVADELVSEFSDPQRSMSPTDQAYDQKNIRRRVYDALNVLMAMNIISKEKKEIRWLGLPTNSAQECQILEVEKQKRLERIRVKTQQLHELILQQIAFKNLVNRNKKQEKEFGTPAPNSAIHLPFIIVNTSKKTVIDCSISSDKMEYLFTFDNTFEIHDDIEVLKRMGLTFGLEKGDCHPTDLEMVKRMVPKSLENYVVQMSQGNSARISCSSIVAGPSGIRTGRPSSRMENSEGSDNRIQDGSDVVSQPDSQDVTDTEMVNVETGSTRRTSRQSSVASDSLQLRLDVATTSDDEEFSESESEEEDNESVVDNN